MCMANYDVEGLIEALDYVAIHYQPPAVVLLTTWCAGAGQRANTRLG